MNFSVTYKNIDNAKNALKMFELSKLVSLSIMEGNFHSARTAQRKLARTAISDFDTFITLPKIKITNVPLKEWLILGFRSLEYKIYKFFTKKTPAEKTLALALSLMKKAKA